MRTFKGFNKEGLCPICGTNEDKPCVLIPISGTEKGNIAKAKQIHLDCIELTFMDKDDSIKSDYDAVLMQFFVRKDK